MLFTTQTRVPGTKHTAHGALRRLQLPGALLMGVVLVAPCAGYQAHTVAAAGDVLRLSDAQRERCLAVLRSAFASEEFWPAMHAAEGLTMTGRTAEVQKALGPRLPQETDDRRRCGLARELVRSGDQGKVAILMEILAKEDPYGHTHAAESLYKIGEVGDGRLLRMALSKGASERLRIMAAAALARSGRADALQFVRRQLTAPSQEQRELATWILARLGDRSDIEALRTIVREDNDAVTRSSAFAALAMFGDETGRRALANDLGSADTTIRSYAAEIAGYCRDLDLADRLLELLNDPHLDVRVRSAQSLLMMSMRPSSQPRALKHPPSGKMACGCAVPAPQCALPRAQNRRVARRWHRYRVARGGDYPPIFVQVERENRGSWNGCVLEAEA